jgi:hypothetical protein
MTTIIEAPFDTAHDALLFALHFDGSTLATSAMGRLALDGCIGSGKGLSGQDGVHVRAILRGRLEALPKHFAAVLIAQITRGESWEQAVEEIRLFIASIPVIAGKVNDTILELAIRKTFGEKLKWGEIANRADVHANTVTRQFDVIEPELNRIKAQAWEAWRGSVAEMINFH